MDWNNALRENMLMFFLWRHKGEGRGSVRNHSLRSRSDSKSSITPLRFYGNEKCVTHYASKIKCDQTENKSSARLTTKQIEFRHVMYRLI